MCAEEECWLSKEKMDYLLTQAYNGNSTHMISLKPPKIQEVDGILTSQIRKLRL
jgi:hypothetical protein